MLRISSSVMEWKEKSGVLNKIIGQGKDIPTSNISQKVLIFEKKKLKGRKKVTLSNYSRLKVERFWWCEGPLR